MTRYTIMGLLLLIGHFVHAQSYNNIAQQLGITAVNVSNEHGAGTSCVDFNQDGADDLTYALDDQIVTYRNVNGLAQLVDYGFEVDDNAKHPVWVDFDNDGDLDFYFTQSLHPNKLYRNDAGVFIEVTAEAGLPVTNVSSFGSSWADYDRDGDLDLFECTYIYSYLNDDAYDWHNHLHRNNGDGTFTDVTMSAGVSDGISLSFQSIWADFNNDNWPDLYVINDLEHPNRLYINNSDGTFTETAEEWGAAVTEMDAMTASVGDFNNDGKLDIFITNTSIGQCALLKNLGDEFVNVAVESNVTLNMLTWGAVWLDVDLDMDMDLYVCENNYLSPQLPNPFLRNNGDGFFVNQATSTFFFDTHDSYSVAANDWNNDGRPDIAVSNFAPQNATLWTSNQAGEHWLKLNLEGVVSNSKGIGAFVTIWADEQQQVKQLFCGENYLGQNTNELLFGLGESTVADSVSVFWPSGFEDKWYNVPGQQAHYLIEGETFSCGIIPSEDVIICEGDSISFQFEGEASYLEWTNGSNTNETWINEEGAVALTVVNEFGFSATSEQVYVSFETFPENDVIAINPLCFGSQDGSISVLFEDEAAIQIEWADGQTGTEVDSLAAGNHDCTLVTELGCMFTSSVALQQPDPLHADVFVEDALCFNTATGSADVVLSGGSQPYDINWNGDEPNELEAGGYQILCTDANGCEFEFSFEVEEPELLEVSIEDISCLEGEMTVEISTSGGTLPYQWVWSNGLQSEDFYGPSGVYTLYVTDENGCQLSEEQISCPVGIRETAHKSGVFPNPASTEIFFVALPEQLGTSIPLFNSAGLVCKRVQVTEMQTRISVDDLAQGIYFFNGHPIAILRK